MDTASPTSQFKKKRRPQGLSPGPAMYEPSAAQTAEQKEAQMKMVTEDHGKGIGILVDVLVTSEP